MTFSSSTYQIDGGNTTSQLWRQALDAALQGSPGGGGIVNPLDCLVTCSGTNLIPLIADGKFTIEGQEIADQGTYFGYNVGTDNSLSIAPTTGTPRSDMIVARAEDPTFAGSPWGGSPAAETIFPRVISGVSNTAIVPPGGQSAIPLARIDMPATASTILPGYITDLRQMANAKRSRTILQTAGGASPVNWTVGTTPTAWPPTATWQVAVPLWGTGVKMRWLLMNTVYTAGGTNFARGNVYPVFGASVTSPNQVFTSTLVSINSTVTFEVMGIAGSADATVSTALRGTTQTLQFAQTTDGTQTGIIEVTEGSVFVMDIEFIQKPVSS